MRKGNLNRGGSIVHIDFDTTFQHSSEVFRLTSLAMSGVLIPYDGDLPQTPPIRDENEEHRWGDGDDNPMQGFKRVEEHLPPIYLKSVKVIVFDMFEMIIVSGHLAIRRDELDST